MIWSIYLLLLSITVFPKINIINVGISTGIRIEDLLILLNVVLILLSVFSNQQGKLKIKSKGLYNVTCIFFIYLLVNFVSTLFGYLNGWIDIKIGLLYCIRKFEYFILIFVGWIYAKKTYKNEKKLIYFFDLVIILHLSFSLLQYFGLIGSFNAGEKLARLTQGRVSSTFNGAYELSAFLLLLLPYYIYDLNKKNFSMLHNIFFILIILFLILLSKSRTSLLLSVFIIGIMYITKKDKSYKDFVKNSLLLIITIILIIILLLYNKIDLSRFELLNFNSITNIFEITWKYKNFDNYITTGSWYGNCQYSLNDIEKLGMDASLYVRVSHWMQMFDGFIHNPILGLGDSISGTAADGNYVRIISESGLLGLTIWIYLLFKIDISLKNSEYYSNIIRYSFLSLILGATLIDLFEASKVMMLMWFLLGVSYYYHYNKNRS